MEYPLFFAASPVIQLRTDRRNAQPCGLVRLPVSGSDETPFLQTLENFNRAIGQHMPVTGEADDIMQLALAVSLMMDRPTLSENVQNTLLNLRDVHWISLIYVRTQQRVALRIGTAVLLFQ